MVESGIDSWKDFFVAQVGAAAALGGLLFVAVSINLSKILEIPALPGRAAEALFELFAVLGVASLGLIPGQTLTAFGIEILIIVGLLWIGTVVIQIRDSRHPGQHRMWIATRVISSQAAFLPLLFAGGTAAAGSAGGLFWLGPGVVLCFAAALIDAWVLLVEIHR
jgi:hypothetical protein